MKRKQASVASTSRKRSKQEPAASPAPHPHGDVDYEQEYNVKAIIGQKGNKYHIEWENDEVTGESYAPTWEPKRNVNQAAIDEWNGEQTKALNSKSSTPKPAQGRGRPRRVIESSPDSSALPLRQSSQPESERPTTTVNESARRELEIFESQQSAGAEDAESPLFEPVDEPAVEPAVEPTVELSQPPSSFGAYQIYNSSDVADSSESVVRHADPDQTSTNDQTRLVPVNFTRPSPRVIPDSQSAIEFSSSAPAATTSDEAQSVPSAVQETQPAANSQLEPEAVLTPLQSLHTDTAQETDKQPLASPALPSVPLPSSPVAPVPTESAPTESVPIESAPIQDALTASSASQSLSEGPKQPETSVRVDIAAEPASNLVLGIEASDPVSKAVAEETSQDTTISYISDQAAEAAASGQLPETIAASAQPQPENSAIGSSDAISLSYVSQPKLSSPSSFGFQTQPVRPSAASTLQSPLHNGHAVRSQAALSSDLGASSLSAAQSSPVRLPGSVVSNLSRSIGTFGESAPPRPTTPSSPASINSTTPSRKMEASRESQRIASEILAAKLKANRERFRKQRQSSVSQSVSSRIASQSPAPSHPSLLTQASQALQASQDSKAPLVSQLSQAPQASQAPEVFQASQASQASQAAQAAQASQASQASQTVQAARAPPSQLSQPAPPLQTTQASPSLLISPAPKLVSSFVASEQNRRSPSFVPAVEPPLIITQEEMNTSERYETLLPPAKDNMTCEQTSTLPLSGTGVTGEDQTAASGLRQSATVVPIGVFHHQRDQYQATVRQNEVLIKRFITTSKPDSELVDEANCFVERMRNLVRHPDLDNVDVFTQYDVEPKHQAQWDISCSAKFKFLDELCNITRDQNLHFAIVAQPNRLLDMLATFLTSIGISNQRLVDAQDSAGITTTPNGLTVTLISVDDQSHYSVLNPTDLVIAMDPTMSGACAAIETATLAKDTRSTHVALAIPGTVDHVEQSVPSSLMGRARLRTLVSGIHQYNSEVGKLAEDQPRADVAAQTIAKYLIAGTKGDWPLATLGVLPDLDSQSEIDPDQPLADIEVEGSQQANVLRKRAFDYEDNVIGLGNGSKKARYDLTADAEVSGLPTTINPLHIEITHISDTTQEPTQFSVSTDVGPAQRTSQLSENEQHLHELLKVAQNQLKEHIEALSEVQYRIEEHRERLIEVSNARDDAIATAQQAITRMTETMNKHSTLKAERTGLKQQLDAANAKLLDHSIPERAEFEALRQDTARIQAEKEQLEKRLQTANQDNEYSREMYQTSSQSAIHLASQASELENQNASLRNKATSELVRLRQMGYDAQTTAVRDENKKLKALLKEREAGLKARDEEIAKLKEASRGRMGTRGTSVPRSPRLRSPQKEGMRGWGSRQGSPAVGEGKGKALHPLRQG